VASSAFAQDQVANLKFSFSNPGARSLGLGGAFAALADDATAAYANPAGLIQLLRPEVSLEGRLWSFSTKYTAGGRISGAPTGNLLDNTAGLREGVSSEQIASLSFLSFVLPRGRWALAFYVHKLANFELETQTQGLFRDVAGSSGIERFEDLMTFTDFEADSFSAVGSVQLTETFSVGLGMSLVKARFTHRAETFKPVGATVPEGFFGENQYLSEARILTNAVTADDYGLAINLGALWRLAQNWSLAGFYRGGPELDVTSETRAGPAFGLGVPSDSVVFSEESPVSLPDVFGIGGGFRAFEEAMTIGFEWDRVRYSRIIDSLNPALTEDLELNDGNEFHLGFEYVFFKWTPVFAIRLGAWAEPPHRFTYVGPSLIDRAILHPGDDEFHFAFGAGLAVERFQIDFGLDLSDQLNTASLSAIFSF
jgi:long-subunit fatty acid transport protein